MKGLRRRSCWRPAGECGPPRGVLTVRKGKLHCSMKEENQAPKEGVRRAWLAQPARTQVGWLHELRVLRHVICVDGERLSWPMVVGVEKKAPKTHMDGRPAQAGKVARRNALTFLMQKLLKVAHTREKLVGSTLRCSRNDYQIVTTHQAPIFSYAPLNEVSLLPVLCKIAPRSDEESGCLPSSFFDVWCFATQASQLRLSGGCAPIGHSVGTLMDA